jgi:ATP-binding cassette subfamily B protein
MITTTFMSLPELMTQLQRTLGATERVREILEEEVEDLDEDGPAVRLRGEIEMDNVNFAYATRPDVTVLRDFSFAPRPASASPLSDPAVPAKPPLRPCFSGSTSRPLARSHSMGSPPRRSPCTPCGRT